MLHFMSSPQCYRLALALGLLAGMSVGTSAQQQQATSARNRSTGPVRASSVRFTPSPQGRRNVPLGPQQRAALFHDLSGIMLEVTAFKEPVRMTPNYLSHANGMVLVSVEGAVTNPGKSVADPGFWILRTTPLDVDVWESQLSLEINRAAILRPILLDCAVNAPDGADLKLIQVYGSTQLLTLTGSGHVLAIIQPPTPDHYQATFIVKMVRPKSSMYVDYCDLTALK